MSHQQVLDAIRDNVKLAVSYTDDVEFSAQDATRTELDFLLECFRVAVECGATTINVPDTVGYATPTEFGELVRVVREATPDHVVISTHCHNDLGLAVANSLAGIENGARQVEVAVNGIGERAGNCSLEEIAMIVRTRGQALGVTHDLNIKEIVRTSRLVSMTTGYGVQPNKAVVGASAFAHESGIHQHGVLSNRATYEIMDPLEIGLEGNRLVLGKHSGRHAFVDALEKIGLTIDAEHLDRAFARFKDLADRKIQITDQDLEAIVGEERGAAEEGVLVLESLQVGGGTHLSPSATVRLRRGEELIEESAFGDGMIDAAMRRDPARGRRGGAAHHVQRLVGDRRVRRARRRRRAARRRRPARDRPRRVGGRRGGERARVPRGDQPRAPGLGRAGPSERPPRPCRDPHDRRDPRGRHRPRGRRARASGCSRPSGGRGLRGRARRVRPGRRALPADRRHAPRRRARAPPADGRRSCWAPSGTPT